MTDKSPKCLCVCVLGPEEKKMLQQNKGSEKIKRTPGKRGADVSARGKSILSKSLKQSETHGANKNCFCWYSYRSYVCVCVCAKNNPRLILYIYMLHI